MGTFLIILHSIITIGLAVLVFRLYKSFKILFQISTNRGKVLTNLYNSIKNNYDRLKELDKLGAFESDDEVGTFFITLKTSYEDIDKYISEEGSLFDKPEE